MMFEQQLHDELVRAARRAPQRSGSRLFTPLMGASVVAVFAIGVLALLVLRPSDGNHARHQQPLSAPPGIAQSLYDNFAVLRRPRTPADRLPMATYRGTRRGVDHGTRAQSRLVADRDGAKAWIVPGVRVVCLIVRLSTAGGSEACSRVQDTAAYRTGRHPLGSAITGPPNWKPHRRLVTLLFPDGTSDVQLRRDSQITQQLRIENNAIQIRPRSATSIWLRAPDGTQRHLPFQ